MIFKVPEQLTYVPAWRGTLRGEKNDRYFDFKQFGLCVNVENPFVG
jgi:hypothetical protein